MNIFFFTSVFYVLCVISFIQLQDFICCFLLLFFRFTIRPPNPKLNTTESMFSVTPPSGTLSARGKFAAVLVCCKPDKEVNLKEEPVIICQVSFSALQDGCYVLKSDTFTLLLQIVLDPGKVNNLMLIFSCLNTVSFRVLHAKARIYYGISLIHSTTNYI